MKDKSKYQNHPLWSGVASILESKDVNELPSGTRGYLLHLLHDLENRRGSTNAFYVSERSLDDLSNRINSISSWINNPNNASSIDQQVDACFNALSSEWPAHNGRKVADISKDTYDAYIEDANAKIEEARIAADKVAELKASYESEIADARQRISALEAEAKEGFDEIRLESEKEADELSERIESNYVGKLQGLSQEADTLLQKV